MNSFHLLLEQAKRLEPELILLRRHFHQFPELSFQEVRTSERIAVELRAMGLDIKTGVGGHGIVAELHGDLQYEGVLKPIIAFRADIDALPITEETGLSYKSENPGVMHACDELIGRENRVTPSPKTYGEDFAEYLKFAKGCFFWLGSGPQQDAEQAPGLHSPRFNPDESCLKYGVAMFTGLALKRLSVGE